MTEEEILLDLLGDEDEPEPEDFREKLGTQMLVHDLLLALLRGQKKNDPISSAIKTICDFRTTLQKAIYGEEEEEEEKENLERLEKKIENILFKREAIHAKLIPESESQESNKEVDSNF